MGMRKVTQPLDTPESGVPTRVSGMPRRGLVIFLAIFSALAGVFGGIELMAFSRGNTFLPPLDVLWFTPFSTFFVPGLLLLLVVGGASAACGVLVWRRSRWAIDATILAGGSLTFWILVEVALLRVPHVLHLLFGGTGVALLVLGLAAGRKSPHPRHRWIIFVTAAGAVGLFAPALAGVLLARSGAWGVVTIALIAAGLVEGALLGWGMAHASPLPLDKVRFVGLTTTGVGLAWASALLILAVVGSAEFPVTPLAVVVLLLGAFGVFVTGALQWLELRRHSKFAYLWIRWSALAWVVALPLSFAASPFVDASTPLGIHLALWATSAVLMAHVMALVTWQGVRRVPPTPVTKAARPGRSGLSATRRWGHPETLRAMS